MVGRRRSRRFVPRRVRYRESRSQHALDVRRGFESTRGALRRNLDGEATVQRGIVELESEGRILRRGTAGPDGVLVTVSHPLRARRIGIEA